MNHSVFGVENKTQRELLRCLGNCGMVSLSNAKTKFSYQNIDFLETNKFIKRETVIVNNKTETILYLGNKGRDYTRKHLVYGSLYKWNRIQAKHDLALSKVYLSKSQEERKRWMNSEQLKLWNKTKTVFDGGYINKSGSFVPVEIITSSYSKNKIESIQRAASNYEESEIEYV